MILTMKHDIRTKMSTFQVSSVNQFVYRLIREKEWFFVRARGFVKLDNEGFIHLSTAEQVSLGIIILICILYVSR